MIFAVLTWHSHIEGRADIVDPVGELLKSSRCYGSSVDIFASEEGLCETGHTRIVLCSKVTLSWFGLSSGIIVLNLCLR
jgi:hypothetical protein